MHAALIVAGGLLLSLVCRFGWWFYRQWPKLRREAELVSTCGYLPPAPTPTAQKEMDAMVRLFLFTNVGQVDIEGGDQLAVPGPKMLLFRHSSALDAFVIPEVIRRCVPDRLIHPARYMTGRGNFRAVWGLIGLLIARWGGFSADTRTGHGGPAVDVSVEVLRSGQLLVMAPQGRTHLDGEIGDIKTGAFRIARKAAAVIGVPVSMTCANVEYGRYAPHWMQRMPEALAYLLQIFCFWYFHAGVKVTLQTISSADLPADDEEAKRLLLKTMA